MRAEPLNIAKLTPPRTTKAVSRERLFKRLSDILTDTSAAWLTGPAGSGKSTLAASFLKKRRLKSLWYSFDEGDVDAATFFYYLGLAAQTHLESRDETLPHLAPEYLPKINIFARRYFEKLFGLLPQPMILVFENCHEISRDSLINDILAIAVSVAPEKFQILFTSRNDLPPELTGLKLNRRIEVISNKELRFDLDEAVKFATAQLGTLEQSQFETLITKIDGWASGLVLLVEQLKAGKSTDQLAEALAALTDTSFSYFASEYFTRIDERTKQFLLTTCWLPVMNTQMAANLSGAKDAENILAALVNNNYFIEKQNGTQTLFRFHALFRQFLQAQSSQYFSADELRALKKNAAKLLSQHGYPESAIDLLVEISDWSLLIRETLQLAPGLLAQGRHRVLQKWLENPPSTFIEHTPWAGYWLAKSIMYSNVVEARKALENSFLQFAKRDNYQGQLVCWTGVIESYFYEWGNVKALDEWLERFFKLYRSDLDVKNPTVEAATSLAVFTAMFLRCPDHPQMGEWTDKLMALLHRDLPLSIKLNIANLLLFHFVWYGGDRGKATVVIESLPGNIRDNNEIEPFLKAMWVAHQASYKCWFSDKREEIYEDIEQSLSLAQHHGVHIADSLAMIVGACTAFMDGKLEQGHQFIRGAREALDNRRLVDLSLYHQYMAWEDWLENKLSDAMAHAKTSLEIMHTCGVPVTQIRSYLGMAQISRSLGKPADARRYLGLARQLAKRLKSTNNLYIAYLVSAYFALQDKQASRCELLLSRALKLGREQGYLNVVWVQREQLAELCVFALEREIESDFVLRIVKSLNLLLQKRPIHLQEWPWKARIYTLGRFEVLTNGNGEAPAKVQGRPMDLLRILISLGGRNVRVDHLLEDFCAEEGEKAHQLFHTNLYRLRKLLGGEDTIIWESGQVSLNNNVCWVDAWAFDSLTMDTSQGYGLHRMRRAWQLYQGRFFREELEDFNAVALQERLHNKYIRLCRDFGRALISLDKTNEATDMYWESLKIDSLAEPFYQGLIEIYLEQDRRSEASALLQRYSQLVRSEIGCDPSPKLIALVES